MNVLVANRPSWRRNIKGRIVHADGERSQGRNVKAGGQRSEVNRLVWGETRATARWPLPPYIDDDRVILLSIKLREAVRAITSIQPST